MLSRSDKTLFVAVEKDKKHPGLLDIVDLETGSTATRALTDVPTKLIRLGSDRGLWVLGKQEMRSVSETGELGDRPILLNDPIAVEALAPNRNNMVSDVRQNAPTVGVARERFAAIDQIVILPVVAPQGKVDPQFMRKSAQKLLEKKRYAVIESDNTSSVGEIVEKDLIEARPEWIKRLGPPKARWVMVIERRGIGMKVPGIPRVEVLGFMYDKESGSVLWEGTGVGQYKPYATPNNPGSSPLTNATTSGLTNMIMTLSSETRKEAEDLALNNLLSGIPEK
jgi:hypothetical protein